MTKETRTLIELKDILGTEIECPKCQAKVTIPIAAGMQEHQIGDGIFKHEFIKRNELESLIFAVGQLHGKLPILSRQSTDPPILSQWMSQVNYCL